MRRFGYLLAMGIWLGSPTMSAGAGGAEEGTQGLTAVSGIKVGHHTLAERPTGCTVVLVEAGAVAGVDVRGGRPARGKPIF